jgi:threonine synthase
MYHAWKNGIDPVTMPPIDAYTIADSISAGLPRDRVNAMKAVQETGGFFITVSDQEILSAIPSLARTTGVFAEPAASAAYAGLLKCAREGALSPDARIVVLVTGNGLKDIASARRSVEQAHRITPTLDEVKRIVSEIFRT